MQDGFYQNLNNNDLQTQTNEHKTILCAMWHGTSGQIEKRGRGTYRDNARSVGIGYLNVSNENLNNMNYYNRNKTANYKAMFYAYVGFITVITILISINL